MNRNYALDLGYHYHFDQKSQEQIKLIKLENSIQQFYLFSENILKNFEINIDEIVKKAQRGHLKEYTVDYTRLRNKYFFGERYTYGSQTQNSGLGSERLYPKNSVDPIPKWITNCIIKPLIDAKILPKNFINSVVINDYQPGGCIVSHIDPPQIFDRPIVSVSLFSDSALCFGCKFDYKPLRCSKPLLRLEMPRGVITSISGFAANEITHCVRPEDVTQRRAVILLRRVHYCAPRLPSKTVADLSSQLLSLVNPTELKADDFAKLHQSLIKWQNEGSYFGRIKKRSTRRKGSYTRYTADYYRII